MPALPGFSNKVPLVLNILDLDLTRRLRLAPRAAVFEEEFNRFLLQAAHQSQSDQRNLTDDESAVGCEVREGDRKGGTALAKEGGRTGAVPQTQAAQW
eukprot:1022480-Rhodomonas_salina.2